MGIHSLGCCLREKVSAGFTPERFRLENSLLRVVVLGIHSRLEATESSGLGLKPRARECLNKLVLSSGAKPDCRVGWG